MIENVGDFIDEVLVELSASTTSGYYSDTIIKDWIKQGHSFATSYRKWPMTEGRVSTTYASTEEWSFEGYKPDSFRIMTVGGKRLQKLNFEDYQIFKEERPDSNDRVFTDFGGLVYINPNIDASGTLVAYGQYNPVLDTTDLTATTVFTNWDIEGNRAILHEMLSYAYFREREFNQSEVHHKRAIELLDGVYDRINKEQYAYQTKDRGMFERFDVLKGGMNEELIKRDQW